MLIEAREQAYIRNEKHKTLIAQVANKKMKPKSFLERSLILRQIEKPCKTQEEGKLAANWEGPFRVQQNLNNGAYRLEIINGKPIPRI